MLRRGIHLMRMKEERVKGERRGIMIRREKEEEDIEGGGEEEEGKIRRGEFLGMIKNRDIERRSLKIMR